MAKGKPKKKRVKQVKIKSKKLTSYFKRTRETDSSDQSSKEDSSFLEKVLAET